MRKTTVLLTMVVALVAYSVSSADVSVTRINDAFAGGSWSGLGPAETGGGWDFGELDDFGIAGFDAPVGAAGGGPIPAGFLPDKILFDAQEGGPNGPNRSDVNPANALVAIGPSAGFGNAANMIGANTFVDAFSVRKVEGERAFSYFEFSGLSLLGGPGFNVFIDGVDFGFFSNDSRLVVTGVFNQVTLYDVDGGAEGIYGSAVYKNVPEPASAALVGFMALGMLIRRRR